MIELNHAAIFDCGVTAVQRRAERVAGRNAFRVPGMILCAVLAGCMTVPKPAPAPMTMIAPPPAEQAVSAVPPMPPMSAMLAVMMSAAPEMALQPAPAPTPVMPSVPMANPLMPPAPTPMRMRAPIPTEGAALRARFGAPNFIRREMDSELWRYDSGRCAVFFFFSRAGNELRLRYIDTLPRSMIGPDPICIDSLQPRAEEMASAPMPPVPVNP